jgi:Tol biopolymer transport system component
MSDIGGSNLRQLTQLPSAAITDISWSPNGKEVLLTVQSQSISSLYRYDLASSGLTCITTGNFDVSDARWSAHPSWLIASCNQPNGWQICRIPREGGEPQIVMKAGGVSPYSPHHSDFVYFTRHKQGLWRMPLLGGSAELV